MRSLKQLHAGQSGTVLRLLAEGQSARRLADMGLTPGAVVRVLRTAPLGDPLVLSVRGYRLAIRRSDAALVELR